MDQLTTEQRKQILREQLQRESSQLIEYARLGDLELFWTLLEQIIYIIYQLYRNTKKTKSIQCFVCHATNERRKGYSESKK